MAGMVGPMLLLFGRTGLLFWVRRGAAQVEQCRGLVGVFRAHRRSRQFALSDTPLCDALNAERSLTLWIRSTQASLLSTGEAPLRFFSLVWEPRCQLHRFSVAKGLGSRDGAIEAWDSFLLIAIYWKDIL